MLQSRGARGAEQICQQRRRSLQGAGALSRQPLWRAAPKCAAYPIVATFTGRIL
jgi:hypothetical protein